MHREDYKYSCWGDLWKEITNSILSFTKPILKSYRLDKINFVLQSINFVLCFFVIRFLLKPILDKITNKIEDTNALGVEIILILFFFIIMSIVSKQKWLNWKTIFEMKRKMALQFLLILSLINLLIIIFIKQKNYGEEK